MLIVGQADEYDGCFLGLSPHIAVVTNVDWEHVDIFPDEVCYLFEYILLYFHAYLKSDNDIYQETVRVIFRRFLSKIRSGGHLILCGDR